ncbi:PRC-barrel domain containing protein [Streptomyces sp. NPDC058642]|uniref:PRC-barrel domain containing protein n=1 Tax=Streptomyces sp. NPDC058642 TaxID=3346572 RepID=UPI00364EF628
MNEFQSDQVPTAGHTPDDALTGYHVHAVDGEVGKIGAHSADLGPHHAVVHTGLPLLGKDVVIPVEAVSGIDHAARTVRLSWTKDQVKAAPVFDEEQYLGDPRYRDQLGGTQGSGH